MDLRERLIKNTIYKNKNKKNKSKKNKKKKSKNKSKLQTDKPYKRLQSQGKNGSAISEMERLFQLTSCLNDAQA